VTAGVWRAGAVRFPRHVPHTQHALGARVLRPRCSTGREVVPRGERRRRPGTWGQGPALWHICRSSISHSESGTISPLRKRNSPLFACLRDGIAIAPRQSAAAHADSCKPCRKGNALALTRAPCLLPVHCKGRRMIGQQTLNGNDKKTTATLLLSRDASLGDESDNTSPHIPFCLAMLKSSARARTRKEAGILLSFWRGRVTKETQYNSFYTCFHSNATLQCPMDLCGWTCQILTMRAPVENPDFVLL
jgi:hypothetical protein